MSTLSELRRSKKKETGWIQSNIFMRRCSTFVRTEGDRCKCGYQQDAHSTDSPDPEATNAFGEVEFLGFGQKKARYVRVDHEADMETIITLITEQWNLPLPNMLISVIGGTNDFLLKHQLREVVRRGTIKLAKSTGAWITTTGLNVGVSKHVGEAIRDYGFSISGRDKVLAIGIAPWGCVQHNEELIDKNGSWPAQYKIEESSEQDVFPLDPNHSHFILVDDGTQHTFGTEIQFRARLEKAIANTCIFEAANQTIPAVVVMLEGGPDTIETVHNSVVESIPVIIVKHSGRAADIMAYAHQKADTSGSISLVTKMKLKDKILREFGEEQHDTVYKSVRASLKYAHLLTVFEKDTEDSANDVDTTVFKALLKANTNIKENLRLTLEWNRIDVARREIFSVETMWPTGKLDDLMLSALLQDRVDFVKLFLSHGVSLRNFLTKDRLENLYQLTPKSSMQECMFSSISESESRIDIKKIQDVINDQMGDDYFQYKYEDNKDNEPYTFPENELFLWAVLMNRKEMATFFWREVKEALPAALVANRLLNEMEEKSGDTEEKSSLQDHANLFEERAIGVLTKCYDSDEEKAHTLLVQKRNNWGQTSCVLIAVKAENKKFISQRACQSLLDNIWMGEMANSNNLTKTSLSIVCPIFICPLISFTKKYIGKEQVHSSRSGGVISNQERPVSVEIRDVKRSESREDRAINLSRTEKCFAFYQAPFIKFLLNVVSYVIFLAIFSYVVLVELSEEYTITEYILYVWVLTITLEEIRQVFFRGYVSVSRGQICLNIWNKLINYHTNFWNLVDMTTIVLFVIGFFLRTFYDLEYARLILCFSLICFCLRVLQMFSVHEKLGPKLVMIEKMVHDLLYFVAILFVFVVAYGITSQAILYPNTPLSTGLISGVLKRPYFQMYGELFLEEVEGKECVDELCPNESYSNETCEKCPAELGKKVVPIMMGCYILLTNILLLNLLIAMFSYSFQKIQDNTALHWHFQRYDLIHEYEARPPIPPPFILLNHIYRIIRFIFRMRNDPDKFSKDLSNLEEQLRTWENEMTENYIINKEKYDNASLDGKVVSTLKRTEQMMKTIEGLQHQQHQLNYATKRIETRLDDLLQALKNR